MSNREIRESERTGCRRPWFPNSSRAGKEAEEEREVELVKATSIQFADLWRYRKRIPQIQGVLFKEDFKSLTLIDAGIPGVTLLNEIELSDYKRKWNFIFQMPPDLPAELTMGKEDAYVGWWFKNKVFKPGAIPQADVDAYVHAYAREGRMDAAFDYCRKIVDDMEFNKKQFKSKLPIRLLAAGGEHSIPNMGDSLRPYFKDVKSVVIRDSGHFVPEEQPEALAKALLAFL